MELKGTFTANSTIKVRKSPGLNETVVESGSWLYDGNYVPFDQVIKKMVTGLLDLNTYNLVQVTNISIAQYVKSQTKNKNQKEKYWGKINWK